MKAQEFKYPYLDPSLSVEQRVDDLISRMTLQEKLSQLRYDSPAIERLGIPEYNWWNECLHGVARAGRATVFPQAIGLGATWDPELLQRIGRAIGIEARAKYNAFSKEGRRGQYMGLTFWSPNVNIFRDPRWGRGQETYGEDPYLTSRIGVAFVRGLQGDHPDYLLAGGMAKHFAVHNGPEGLRHSFDAEVSMKDLWETYLPAFEALVTEAGVEGVMGAYNRVNGQPCCANEYLLKEVLRKRWDFMGYVVSDCWALHDFCEGHDVVDTPEAAAALALNSGCNLNCGDTYRLLEESIKKGLTDELMVDRNLRQLLPTRFRLGMFDPPGRVPFNTIGPELIRSPEHLALSREAAVKSMVLLKNQDKLLPLDKDLEKIYVVGPTATHIQGLLANYYGLSEGMVTFLEGIVGKVGAATSVEYSQGTLLDEEKRNPIDWFTGTAATADVTIACVGLSQLIEGEEGESIASRHKGDRVDIGLPPNQVNFLKSLRESSRKLVVVVTGGSAIALQEVYDLADAVIFAWYPGEQGGNALADLLFGDAVPSGRLPVTFVRSVNDLPPFEEYSMRGRTYRYMKKEPQFPFGFGLSYTTFEYLNLSLDRKSLPNGLSIEIRGSVRNTGERDADEVIQLYLRRIDAGSEQPLMALKAFQRIRVAARQTVTYHFTLSSADLASINELGEPELFPGDYEFLVGGCSPSPVNERLGASGHASATIRLP